MIRNFLYALSLHIMVAFLLIINSNIRIDKVNKDPELKTIVIPKNIDIKKINITLKNKLNFLTIKEKLQLYEYLIESGKIADNKEYGENQELLNLLKEEKKTKGENFAIKDYFNVQGFYKDDVVFLGIQDYNKYVKGTVLEKRVVDRRILEQKNKIDISKIDKDSIFTYKDFVILSNIVFKQNQAEELNKKEILMVQEQLAICYKDAIIKNGHKLAVPVSIELNLGRDGYIDTKSIKLTIIDKKNQHTREEYALAVEIIKTIIVLCNPIRDLPLLKYGSWEKINFVFEI
ncbi:MAG: hypothetical protein LBG48_05535 [Rickettsiales bacterium]|jgi:hypothetical protein|nr:hypothetical protein [Rickettsiales bacterium]